MANQSPNDKQMRPPAAPKTGKPTQEEKRRSVTDKNPGMVTK